MKANTSRFTPGAFALILVLMSGPLVSHADILLYDTFGPGDSHYASSGYNVGSSYGYPSGYMIASSFTNYGVTLPLSRIVVSTLHREGPGGMLVSLVADNGGMPTGTTLETFSGTFSGMQYLDSVSQPLLMSGQSYWVIMESQNPLGGGIWLVNNQNYLGTIASKNSDNSWAVQSTPWPSGRMPTLPTLRIEVIPEPATSFLAVAAACCMSVSARLRRKWAAS